MAPSTLTSRSSPKYEMVRFPYIEKVTQSCLLKFWKFSVGHLERSFPELGGHSLFNDSRDWNWKLSDLKQVICSDPTNHVQIFSSSSLHWDLERIRWFVMNLSAKNQKHLSSRSPPAIFFIPLSKNVLNIHNPYSPSLNLVLESSQMPFSSLAGCCLYYNIRLISGDKPALKIITTV